MTAVLTLNTSLAHADQGKAALADPQAILARVGAAFEVLKERLDKLETPIEAIACALEWAALIEHLEHHAESASRLVGRVAAPLALIALIDKMKTVQQAFFGVQVEGAEAPKTSKVISAGFFIFASLCSAISWLQKTGLLTQAIAITGKMNALVAFCNLAIATIGLVEATNENKNKAQILKAVLNVIVAIGTIVLLASTLHHLPFLLLLLGTGTLVLNIMYPEKEYEERVKAATA